MRSPARVLVAGGGVAGLETVLALQARGEDLAPELLAPARHFVHRPLAVLEPFAEEPQTLRLPLAAFGRERGVPVHRDLLARVLPDEQEVITAEGRRLDYDALVVALGARSVEAVPGALTFRGRQDAGRVRELVRLAGERRARELAFVVPRGTTWSLPLYELALQAAAAVRGAARLTLVTPEPAPLAAFGERASVAVAAVLAERGVELRAATAALEVAGGLLLTDTGELPVDAVVALARLVGPHLPGLPSDPLGFVPVDEHAAVLGVDGVFAVGDVAAAGMKQGGLAAQQADAAAAAIGARATGEPPPPVAAAVLRGALVTGAGTLYLRHVRGGASEASWEPLWWPPAKLAAPHLSHHLAARLTTA